MNKLVLIAPFLALLLVPIVNAEASLGDDWAAIKKGAGNAYKAETMTESLTILADTKVLYESSFANAAKMHDPDTHNVIMDCYADSKAQYENGDKKQAKLINQCLEKSIYTIAMVKMEDAISKNNAQEYLDWSTVLQKKFKVSDKDPGTLALFTAIENDPSKLKTYSAVIRENMLNIFELKTVEELEEALIKYAEDDTYSAKKYAYEGLYYYRTLHPYAVESIGSNKANTLMNYMVDAKTVADSANDGKSVSQLTSEMKSIKKEVEKLVMEHNGISGTPEALALAGIADRLYLVKIEYIDAVDSSGNIINDMEYAETVAFAGGAVEIAEENADVLSAISSSDFNMLQSILSEIVFNVDNKAAIYTVLSGADDATVIVKNLQLSTGEGGANLGGYFDTIDRLLITSQAAYTNGDSDLAFELVSEAYLDNYEFLEAPIGEVDSDLMLKIEDNMREELRNMIKDNSSNNLINAQISMIVKDLDTAESLLLGNVLIAEATSTSVPESTEGGGCLIATAAYGSEMAPQVQFLREIRDNTVLQTQSGTSFMTAFNSFYYTFSPTVADYERENIVFKEAVKVGLTPLLTSLTILNYVDIDTEQEMLGYGIGIIMLNIGMYFVAPAVVVIALSKKLRK